MSQLPELDPEKRKFLRDTFGWTDGEIDGHILPSPKLFAQLTERLERTREHKMIAEVTLSKGCGLKIIPGDRYVFAGTGGVIISHECTAPLCLWALAPMMPFTWMLHDRLFEGIDPNGIFYDRVRCTDVGLECGGVGEVWFKVFFKKEPWTQDDIRAHIAKPVRKQ